MCPLDEEKEIRLLSAHLSQRPRRNRKLSSIRKMVQETQLHPSDFVLPLFVMKGQSQRQAIHSMPGCYHQSQDLVIKQAKEAYNLGIPAVALFPAIEDKLKDKLATEAKNPNGLIPKAIKALKEALPELCIITDVAMDPYSSDGHDGVVQDGEILNDVSLDVLAEMALTQAQAGADYVAPSDMMDGRVGYIRSTLDESGFENTGIISYAAKYASAFYGPFREALGSAPKTGDKKTYQMDPANSTEALREVQLDIEQGADIIMIKPALSYLDIIYRVKSQFEIPVAAYSVSGEYSLIKAAAEKSEMDERALTLETLTSIKRAGADIIFSYSAVNACKWI